MINSVNVEEMRPYGVRRTYERIEIPEISQKLLAAKTAKRISFADLESILNRDEVWIAVVFYRQASASETEVQQILAALGLSQDLVPELTAFPAKGLGPVCLPTH